jgi:hypothetical protein
MLLILALIPVLNRLHLPIVFDWTRLISLYWLVLATQSIFVATLLFLIGGSMEQGLGPFLVRIQQNKIRIVFGVSYFVILLWALTWLKALILTMDTIALLEFWERVKTAQQRKKLLGVLPPAIYLFAGFLLVFAYNDIIVSVRFYGAADSSFNAIDTWLLQGSSVSRICHWALQVFPVPVFKFLEFIYYGMFPQVGAALLITTLYFGKRRGLQFVGAILTAYYLALVLFYLWPSQGPYYLCPAHFSVSSNGIETFAVQKSLLANAQRLWDHFPLRQISTDYYIAFPCMHIAQPLIVMWFLRRWKRMVLALAVFDLVLVIAILFLEWHYVVDILASFPLAAMAIASVDGRNIWIWMIRRETGDLA